MTMTPWLYNVGEVLRNLYSTSLMGVVIDRQINGPVKQYTVRLPDGRLITDNEHMWRRVSPQAPGPTPPPASVPVPASPSAITEGVPRTLFLGGLVLLALWLISKIK